MIRLCQRMFSPLRLEVALIAGLILSIWMSGTLQTACQVQKLEQQVLRLHVLANSDSEEDQARKLSVRDALLAESERLFAGCESLSEMTAAAQRQLSDIQMIAEETLRAQGCADPVTVSLEETRFDQRTYESLTMPAGTYLALRVELGDAAGKNWWCVMYPPLCLPAAKKTADETFDEETRALLTQPEQYEVRLKCVEWFVEARDYVKKRFAAS